MYTALQNINQQVTDQEVNIGNPLTNMVTVIKNIKQEGEVIKEGLENLHSYCENDDTIYVFENTDSSYQDKNTVDYGLCVEIMKIKQEPDDNQEQISESENKIYLEDVKCDPEFEETLLKTERSDLTIKTDYDLATRNSNLENITTSFENTCADIKLMDFKTEDGLNINEKNLVKLKNTGLFNCCNARNRDNTEDTGSIMDKIPLKMDSIVLHMENYDLKSKNSIDNFVSQNHVNVDLQPIVLLKRLPDTVFNQKCESYQPAEKEFYHFKRSLHSISYHERYESKEESPIETSGKVLNQLNISTRVVTMPTDSPVHSDLVAMSPDSQVHSDVAAMSTDSDVHPYLDTFTQTVKCILCGKELMNLNTLTRHLQTHKDDRPHQCQLCDNRFKTAQTLHQHQATHSTERPYRCTVCDKTFKIVVALSNHMVCHQTERPHRCNVCAKEFKAMRHLRSHMISHQTERPHPCNVCRKAFKTANSLRIHQGGECEEGYKTVKYLRQHIQSLREGLIPE